MEIENFKSDLRGVLIGEKYGIDIKRLYAEFRDLGVDLDYDRRLYSSLESFLSTLTDTCRLKR